MEWIAFLGLVAVLAFWPRKLVRYLSTLVLVVGVPSLWGLAAFGVYSLYTTHTVGDWQVYAAAMVAITLMNNLAGTARSLSKGQPFNALGLIFAVAMGATKGAVIYLGGVWGGVTITVWSLIALALSIVGGLVWLGLKAYEQVTAAQTAA